MAAGIPFMLVAASAPGKAALAFKSGAHLVVRVRPISFGLAASALDESHDIGAAVEGFASLAGVQLYKRELARRLEPDNRVVGNAAEHSHHLLPGKEKLVIRYCIRALAGNLCIG
jgi:hypothetical protein